LDYFHNLAAAVCAIIRCANEIALIVRGRDPGRGLLDFPGGFVDPGEDLETAVLREVREEIGIDLPAPRYLFSIPNTYHYRHVDYWTIDAMFEFDLADKPPAIANDEVLALQWRRPSSVTPDELAFASVRSAIRRLQD
jgi:ADP-ribose pyrophosphatase YjhB (NUDIX family)